ncbi:enoyl-CoA hydratase-related protein [soil metagenome]
MSGGPTDIAAVASLPLLYEKRGAIAIITFNRPAARNALTPEMICRFADAIIDFAADDDLRVAIVTGSGDKAFCAGGDLATAIPLLTGARPAADEWDRRVLEDPLVMPASGLRDFPLYKPVIAAINGACLAAGQEIALGTDIRVAAEHAIFGLPEVKRGVIPFAGSMVRLPRQLAYAQAMEMMLTGDSIDAREAWRIGLVNHVVPAADVMTKALEIAGKIAANGPVAVQRVKQTVMSASGRSLAEGYAFEDESKRVVLATEDAAEGPRAFMEKRAPRFVGR